MAPRAWYLAGGLFWLLALVALLHSAHVVGAVMILGCCGCLAIGDLEREGR